MPFGNFWTTILNSIKPIKTIFSFYVALYIIPLSFIAMIGYDANKNLFFKDTNQINLHVAIILAICALSILIWTAFFLIYFTRQRTKNPHLYNKGFLSNVSIRDKENEFIKE